MDNSNVLNSQWSEIFKLLNPKENCALSKLKGLYLEDILLELDKAGICASGGSACSSGTSTPSHVLLAIKLEKEWIEGTIRITLGEENTKEDIDYLIKTLVKIIQK